MVRRLVRALASLFGLAVITAVPWMLWAVIRGPLTDRSVEELRSALGRGELPPEVVVAVLVVVAALAWFQVVVAVVVEVAARVRRRPVPTVRGLGSGQRLAALLVGGLTVIATLAPRTPGGEPRRAHAYALAQPVGVEPGRSLDSAAAASPSIVVQHGDTLSGIAAAHLGSVRRAPLRQPASHPAGVGAVLAGGRGARSAGCARPASTRDGPFRSAAPCDADGGNDRDHVGTRRGDPTTPFRPAV
jgi:hypothetical protein